MAHTPPACGRGCCTAAQAAASERTSLGGGRKRRRDGEPVGANRAGGRRRCERRRADAGAAASAAWQASSSFTSRRRCAGGIPRRAELIDADQSAEQHSIRQRHAGVFSLGVSSRSLLARFGPPAHGEHTRGRDAAAASSTCPRVDHLCVLVRSTARTEPAATSGRRKAHSGPRCVTLSMSIAFLICATG